MKVMWHVLIRIGAINMENMIVRKGVEGIIES